MSSTWFAGVQEVSYSIVEYIPLVGTLYSLKRAGVAYSERDWKLHWASLANFADSAVREAILTTEGIDLETVAILHTMAENITDAVIVQFFKENNTPRFEVKSVLDMSTRHVIVAGSKERSAKEAPKLFAGKAKGVHQFHGAIFNGILKSPKFAPEGEKIQLSLPQGFQDNAPCYFLWRWTIDVNGVHNRPESTFGRLKIIPGDDHGGPTGFRLSSRSGVGWEGYDFRGSINSANDLSVTTDASANTFTMTRRNQT